MLLAQEATAPSLDLDAKDEAVPSAPTRSVSLVCSFSEDVVAALGTLAPSPSLQRAAAQCTGSGGVSQVFVMSAGAGSSLREGSDSPSYPWDGATLSTPIAGCSSISGEDELEVTRCSSSPTSRPAWTVTPAAAREESDGFASNVSSDRAACGHQGVSVLGSAGYVVPPSAMAALAAAPINLLTPIAASRSTVSGEGEKEVEFCSSGSSNGSSVAIDSSFSRPWTSVTPAAPRGGDACFGEASPLRCSPPDGPLESAAAPSQPIRGLPAVKEPLPAAFAPASFSVQQRKEMRDSSDGQGVSLLRPQPALKGEGLNDESKVYGPLLLPRRRQREAAVATSDLPPGDAATPQLLLPRQKPKTSDTVRRGGPRGTRARQQTNAAEAAAAEAHGANNAGINPPSVPLWLKPPTVRAACRGHSQPYDHELLPSIPHSHVIIVISNKNAFSK